MAEPKDTLAELRKLAEDRDGLWSNATVLKLLAVVEAAKLMRKNWSPQNLTRHPLPAAFDVALAALETKP